MKERKVIVILTILLILSASSIYYLKSQATRTSELDEFAMINLRGYVKSMKSLEKQLTELSNSNWDDPYLLSSALRYTNESLIYASEINKIAIYTNQRTQKSIQNANFGGIEIQLENLTLILDKELQLAIKQKKVSKILLSKLQEEIKEAKYNNLENLSWDSVAKSNDYFLEKFK